MPLVLSFDVGIKALGVALVEYADLEPIVQALKSLKAGTLTADFIRRVQAATAEPITIRRLEVYDISATSMVAVSRRLRQTLEALPTADVVLIENQFAFRGNTQVMAQILYHYSEQEVHLVSPRKKNKLTIGGHLHKDFLKRYANSYGANKAHTKAMVLHWLEARDQMNLVAHIPKPIRKDACDAAAQAIAWIWFGP